MGQRSTPGRTVQGGPDLDALRRSCGVMTMNDLGAAVRETPREPELIEGLIRARSILLLVGNSTIGKTPLVLQLLLSLAAGVPFLGRKTARCSVLYMAGEGDPEQIRATIQAVAAHLKLAAVPDSLLVWSPHWSDDGPTRNLQPGNAALLIAERVGADVTAADPLRVFWPQAEGKTEDATRTYAALRKVPTTWIVPHHLRKPDRKIKLPALDEHPSDWLIEASGSRALVTGADLRLGIEARTEQQLGDLLLCGMARGRGQVGPLYLERTHDEAGDPLGYSLMQGLQLLSETDRAALLRLPVDQVFRFSDAKRVLGGKSDSNAARLLDRGIALGLVFRVGEHYARDRHAETTGVVEQC